MTKPHTTPASITLRRFAANPKNPRKVTKAKLNMLKASMAKFGDLGCIILNRTTGHLVGGHQRIASMGLAAKDTQVTLLAQSDKPDKVGTVAYGHILLDGASFNYREVVWTEEFEQVAMVAANKGAGDWAFPELKDLLMEFDSQGYDLDLTMFDKNDLDDLFGGPAPKDDEAKQDSPASNQPQVVVTCLDQDEQQTVFQLLTDKGYNCVPRN